MAVAQSLAAAAVRTTGWFDPKWGAALALPLFAHVSAPHPIAPADDATMWRAERSSVRIPGIDRAGADLTVYEWGRADGPVVVLAHGWNGRASQFATLARELVSERYHVVAFDAPAHGDSAGGATYIVDWVDALGALQERHGRFTAVVGHSFGGLGTLIGASRGIAVDKVVTVASPADADLLLVQFQGMLGFDDRTAHALRARFARRYFPGDVDPFGRLSPVQHPLPPGTQLLVVHDETDRMVPFGEAARISGANPGARSLATRGHGHSRILRADPFLDAVMDFVAAPTEKVGVSPESRGAASAHVVPDVEPLALAV